MGNMQQIGWAESGLDMEIALSASFASNFHPPLPQELVAPTAEAIRLCADCYDDEETLAVTYVSLPHQGRRGPTRRVLASPPARRRGL